MTVHPIDTEALRKLADAATPGPWTVDNGGGYDFSVTQGPDGDYLACDVIHPDAEFIAAARTAVPDLLDALAAAEHRATRAEAEVKRLSWKVGHLVDKYNTDMEELRRENEEELSEGMALRMKAVAAATRAEAQSAIRGRAVAIYQARARTAEKRVQAVRDVHQPLDALHTNTGRVRQVCTGCGTDAGNWQVWPCPTIRALKG